MADLQAATNAAKMLMEEHAVLPEDDERSSSMADPAAVMGSAHTSTNVTPCAMLLSFF
jgi:hypothetical protein